jgi:hypothetical protein
MFDSAMKMLITVDLTAFMAMNVETRFRSQQKLRMSGLGGIEEGEKKTRVKIAATAQGGNRLPYIGKSAKKKWFLGTTTTTTTPDAKRLKRE